MAIGKRERADLKTLGVGRKDADRDRERAGQHSLSASLDSRGGEIGKDGLPLSLANAKSPSASACSRRHSCACAADRWGSRLQHSSKTTCAAFRPPCAASRNSCPTRKRSRTA